MVSLNQLKSPKGATKKSKRIGRGPGSGVGQTAGRGNNGAKAHSGFSSKFYFEGGQTPLTRRIPKKGFNHVSKIIYQIVNLDDLQKIEADLKEIDVQWLYTNGLIHSVVKPVKILGNGDYTKSYTIKANAFSKSSREKIEKAKGKAEVIRRA
jgi:large subunit ribosomal protein L15